MRTTSRITKIIVVTGIVLCLFGCHHEGDGHEADGHQADGHQADGHQADGHEADQGLELTLNDGEKWPVDDSTRESATRLAGLVGGVESIGSVEDARALGKALDQELDTLVKGCKMTGPGHDQLHVFLVALFPQVEALEKQADLAELQQTREEIGGLLEAYEAHFD